MSADSSLKFFFFLFFHTGISISISFVQEDFKTEKKKSVIYCSFLAEN